MSQSDIKHYGPQSVLSIYRRANSGFNCKKIYKIEIESKG